MISKCVKKILIKKIIKKFFLFQKSGGAKAPPAPTLPSALLVLRNLTCSTRDVLKTPLNFSDGAIIWTANGFKGVRVVAGSIEKQLSAIIVGYILSEILTSYFAKIELLHRYFQGFSTEIHQNSFWFSNTSLTKLFVLNVAKK